VKKVRREAFSDGVLAAIITMVLGGQVLTLTGKHDFQLAVRRSLPIKCG